MSPIPITPPTHPPFFGHLAGPPTPPPARGARCPTPTHPSQRPSGRLAGEATNKLAWTLDADDEFNSLLNAAGAPTATTATAPAATAPAAAAPAAAAVAATAPAAAAPDAAAPAASAEGEGDWLEEMAGEFAEAKE